MSLKVGIHENVALDATVNDKGTLQITAKVVAETEEDPFNLDEVTIETDSEESQNFLVFPLQHKGYENKELVEHRSLKLVVEDIKDMRTQFAYILSQYTTTDNIEWNLYANSDITTDNQAEKLNTVEGLKVVYDNLVNQFVAQMKEFGDPTKLFRILLVRTSKKSHYPKLRNKYLTSSPFLEPMDIPVKQSKLAFTKGEIAAGLDNGDPIVENQSAADKDTSGLDASGL